MKPRWLCGSLAALGLAVGASGCRRSDRSTPKGAPSAVSAPAASLARGTGATPSALASQVSATMKHEADTVSHASETYTAGPAVVTSGKVNGALLRKRHIARLKSEKSPVVLLRGESALDLGQRICEAVVPARPAATPILVKPNICGFDSIKSPEKSPNDNGVTGRITDPEFVRGVVRCLKARGHQRVTLAEGCGLSHQHFLDTIRVSGYEAMAREENVPLVALDDDGVFDVEGEQPGKPLAISGIAGTHVPTLLMPKLLGETLERGLFISVPKLKAHRYSVVSLSIKGMQGTVMRSDASPAYNQKWRMHAELKDYLHARRTEPEDRAAYVASLDLFAERMVDVLEVSSPDVVLVDGAPPVAGDGFQNLRMLPDKIAIGGTHPVFVDKVGAEYLGLWNSDALASELGGHRTSPLIEVAARRYGLDLDKVEVQGDGFVLAEARQRFFKSIAPFAIDGDKLVQTRPHAALPAPSASAAPALFAAPGSASAIAAPTPRGDKPVAHAAHVATLPVTDGRVDAAWSRAARLGFETDYAGAPSGIVTRVRFVWNEAGLCLLAELENAGLRSDLSFPVDRERPKLYEEDCVEVFLGVDVAHPKHYYEIELGPFGHFFDIDVDRETRREDTAWSSHLTLGTTRDAAAHTATIEACLAAPEIVNALRPGARLAVGIFRTEGQAPRHYLAFSPPRTRRPNFHVPEAFGVLAIDP